MEKVKPESKQEKTVTTSAFNKVHLREPIALRLGDRDEHAFLVGFACLVFGAWFACGCALASILSCSFSTLVYDPNPKQHQSQGQRYWNIGL